MSPEKVLVTFDEAIDRLPEGLKVHTFRQAGPMIIGADWAIEDLLQTMKAHEIYETGPLAQGMNHGLAIRDKNGLLFIETKAKPKK